MDRLPNAHSMNKGTPLETGRLVTSKGPLSELQVCFAKAEGRLSKTRRKLLQQILDNSEETYFLSSPELAKRYDMDPATVVRTIQALGYERFADFSADLRKHFIMRITPYSAMKTATEKGCTLSDQVVNSLQKDVDNVTQLRSRLDVDLVVQAAKQIRRARRVLIVGIDFAASLAWYLDYGLTVIGLESEAPVGTFGHLQHKVRSLGTKDLLIAISFGRCLRDAVNAVIEAHSRRTATLGITDSEFSPIAKHCDSHLLVTVAHPLFAASYAAAVALLNAMLIACAHITPERSLKALRRIEQDSHNSERWYGEGPQPQPTTDPKLRGSRVADRYAGR